MRARDRAEGWRADATAPQICPSEDIGLAMRTASRENRQRHRNPVGGRGPGDGFARGGLGRLCPNATCLKRPPIASRGPRGLHPGFFWGRIARVTAVPDGAGTFAAAVGSVPRTGTARLAERSARVMHPATSGRAQPRPQWKAVATTSVKILEPHPTTGA